MPTLEFLADIAILKALNQDPADRLEIAKEALEFCANAGNDEYSTLQKSKEALEKIK